MSQHATDQVILDGACGPDLLHLLTCPTCRAWAIGLLLEPQQVPNEDADLLGAYDAVFDRFEVPSAAVIEATQARRAKALRLSEELLQISRKKRLRVLRRARFRSQDFLEHLLEESQASQLLDAAKGAELAELAFHLANGLKDEEAALAARSRSLLLEANARRLMEDRSGAESRLGQAASFLGDRLERACYCRVAALVRWEDGRTDEAAALLGHALKLFRAEGWEHEVAACLALAGLLEVEEGQFADALPHLTQAWAALDRDVRPHFALRTGLALARCLAEADQDARARNVLREVWRFYSELKDDGETLRAYWGEALILARMQQWSESIHLLESVQPKLLAEGSNAEASLLSVDLALVLAEAGRSDEVMSLEARLPANFGANAQTASALREIAALGEKREPRLHSSSILSRVTLLRTFRLCGLSIRPLPFV
ncbi:MAG TPA: tetratricopeptide repeat protein [Thermoanaerobaculia bacterium]|nr:tetratricopeptide repeat protein [Thermoanaerobaculia bacterium]